MFLSFFQTVNILCFNLFWDSVLKNNMLLLAVRGDAKLFTDDILAKILSWCLSEDLELMSGWRSRTDAFIKILDGCPDKDLELMSWWRSWAGVLVRIRSWCLGEDLELMSWWRSYNTNFIPNGDRGSVASLILESNLRKVLLIHLHRQWKKNKKHIFQTRQSAASLFGTLPRAWIGQTLIGWPK